MCAPRAAERPTDRLHQRGHRLRAPAKIARSYILAVPHPVVLSSAAPVLLAYLVWKVLVWSDLPALSFGFQTVLHWLSNRWRVLGPVREGF
jgi:hypothetical protein